VDDQKEALLGCPFKGLRIVFFLTQVPVHPLPDLHKPSRLDRGDQLPRLVDEPAVSGRCGGLRGRALWRPARASAVAACEGERCGGLRGRALCL